MVRFRRYRVFLVFAICVIGLLYHFKAFSDLERAGAASVEELKSFRIKSDKDEPKIIKSSEKSVVQSETKLIQDVHHDTTKIPPVSSQALAASLPTLSGVANGNDPTQSLSLAISANNDADGSRDTESYISEDERPTPTIPDFNVSLKDEISGNPDEDTLPTASPPKSSLIAEIDETGKGRSEGSSDPSHATIHWSKLPEHFPVPSKSIIQLPSGKPKRIPKIQKIFSDESASDKIDREQKLDVIKKTFITSWEGYKEKAWMHDELRPVSGKFRDPFCGWAATLVDSLDTVWIMGMREDFETAVNAVKEIDFTTTRRENIPLFETVIRYLGGLISAYDLSSGKYRVLLDKAVELAEVLMGAFDTPNRMPMTFYWWKPAFASQPHRAPSQVVLAELGSLSLEFTRLAQITKEPKYYDAVARITNALEVWQNSTKLPGLWPMKVDVSGCKKPDVDMVSQVSHSMLNGPRYNDSQSYGSPDLSSKIRTSISPGDLLDDHVANGQAAKIAGKEKFEIKHEESIEINNDVQPKSYVEADTHLRSEANVAKRQLSDDETTNDTKPAKKKTEVESDCEPQGLASPPGSFEEFFTIGGQADSVYEYLPKQYMLLGGQEDVYQSMYKFAIETTTKRLLFRPMLPDERDVLLPGTLRTSGNLRDPLKTSRKPEGTHLSCFAGGMFAVGAKLFNRENDIDLAKKLTEGCVWAYQATTTGIMPESYLAVPCQSHKKCSWNETLYREQLDPFRMIRKKNANDQAQRSLKDGKPMGDGDVTNRVLKGEKVKDTEDITSADSSLTTTEEQRLNSEQIDADKGNHELKAQVSGANQKTNAIIEHTKHVEPTSEAQDSTPDIAKERISKVNSLTKRQLNEFEDEPPLKTADKTIDTSTTPYEPTNVEASKEPVATAAEKSNMRKQSQPFSNSIPSAEEIVDHRIREERLPPGMTRILSREYILRPEAIESIFILYRITGDSSWRERGWEMFKAITKHTASTYGASAIKDVTSETSQLSDEMESFWLAETLKYFYLLFSDPEHVSLDDWVLNTEAHPFKRPK